MTMSLARGLSTIRTSKPKQKKLTKEKVEQYTREHREYNRRMKHNHRHDECMTFDEYINWAHGKTERRKPVEYQTAPEVKTFDWQPKGYRRDSGAHIPSGNTGKGNALATPKKTYTGSLVKGIATLHKSNAVPVINQEEAEMISKMRRG